MRKKDNSDIEIDFSITSKKDKTSITDEDLKDFKKPIQAFVEDIPDEEVREIGKSLTDIIKEPELTDQEIIDIWKE
ncbi:MAG: hypothetical protein CL760_05410 [Chloroflexi bacterium]|nr:hypothetical protein [Chloroflexota bacterium]|tara:strand:- start:38643 stop:38870 length:228 start_codon:yes stop_codon:yes gene_type:complete